MININLDDFDNRAKCCGCTSCVWVCPKNCITMQEDIEGFLYPVVEERLCVNCGLCEKHCPIIIESQSALEHQMLHEEKIVASEVDSTLEIDPRAYAVMNKNEEIRLASSSGGMFTLLAEQMIRDGGYVFGAAMTEDCSGVHHIGVNTIKDLQLLRGSKYLQSQIGDTYQVTKQLLDKGGRVLFSGTPCQIEGLRAYLGKEYDHLVCVDFICHGVPSPKVWKKYIDFRLSQTDATSVRHTFFRYKNYGWKMYAVLLEYSNNTAYMGKLGEDLYLKAFLRNIDLRPSCHACKFKKKNRVSDITLADFWGIQNVLPKMDDDKGTSLVILHSPKAQTLFDGLFTQMTMQEVEFEKAIKYNSSMICPAKPHKNRSKFFAQLDTLEFDKLVAKYATQRKSFKGIVAAGLRKIGMYEFAKRVYRGGR